MDIANNFWASKGEKIVIAFEIFFGVFEMFASKVFFFQRVLLNHGAHSTIHDEQAGLYDFF